MPIILLLFLLYVFLIIPSLLLFFIDEVDDKYDINYSFVWPYLVFLIVKDIFNFINFYLTQNNLKQMNFKILGKAMSFMFLPTLGVLLVLLVGFFDPIMLWTWIKSDSGWAVFTRIFIFILEAGLVTLLYFHYLKEEIKNNVGAIGKKEIVHYRTNIYELFLGSDSGSKFTIQRTEDPNIVIIEKIKQ